MLRRKTTCERDSSFWLVSARRSRNDKSTTCPRRRARLTSPPRTEGPASAGAISVRRCLPLGRRRPIMTPTIAATAATTMRATVRRERFTVRRIGHVKLSGKNALVTGTSRGIGPAIARGLAAEGARVLCHARREADARARAEELGGVPIFGELSTEDGIASIAEQTIRAAPEL